MEPGELQQILISVLAISVAFTIASRVRGAIPEEISFFAFLAIMLITVGLGFILHEMGHRFVARRYGAHASYTMWPRGLFMALIFSMLGFVFAAPGAVYIFSPYISRRQNGIISLAGPTMNILLAGFFLIFGVSLVVLTNGNIYAALIATYGVGVNIFLAFFNLIPFPPLDGSKVFAWNPYIWGAFFAMTGILVFFGFF